MMSRHPAAENWVENLLGEVCVKLGFCLPEPEQTRLLRNPPPSIEAFADEIFLAEGLNPRLADKKLWMQVRDVVAKHFQMIDRRIDQPKKLELLEANEFRRCRRGLPSSRSSIR